MGCDVIGISGPVKHELYDVVLVIMKGDKQHEKDRVMRLSVSKYSCREENSAGPGE